jgi:pyruvate,water dikinase
MADAEEWEEPMTPGESLVRWFADLTNTDVPSVGGKNASLGEMVRELGEAGVRVPDGFATTAAAYRAFLAANELEDQIREQLASLGSGTALATVGEHIRAAIRASTLPSDLADEVTAAYRELSARYGSEAADVAVRSSATAEDLPDASFAGQQETFLNVRGTHDLLEAVRRCFASLFTDRAIAYRTEHGFDHMSVALSVGVQKMVRSDLAGAGVMFTLDTDSGFPDVVTIDAAWGLGESVVSGTVNPDTYVVFKPLLAEPGRRPILEKTLGSKATRVVYATGGSDRTRTEDTDRSDRRRWVLGDDEILDLARWATTIEDHYGRPMDIEWAKDGQTGELFVVQARPETVQSRRQPGALHHYELKDRGTVLVSGAAIGDAVATGPALRILDPSDMDRFEDGAVLVTDMTDPDWVPIMKRAAAIVTDLGGRTAHAAIVSRELGIPAIVGTGEATRVLADGQQVTVSCAEGEIGHVYDGVLPFSEETIDLDAVPHVRTRIMMNIASPEAAFRWWRLPAHGIGLARMEFIINAHLQVHPLALTRYDQLEDADVRRRIDELTAGYEDRTDFFVERLARGIAMIAASQWPDPVIVRMSDFKTNEYADLLGGEQFEPAESNPMLGFRGASRYYSDHYRDGFALECRAMRMVRDEIGLTNVALMIPFVRTVEEADRVITVLADHGLERGRDGLVLYMMCEIPSNVVLADRFADRFDGFSIGSNDLTQLVLGIDRDSQALAELFDERNEAVTRMIAQVIATAHAHDTTVGICGQAPSDYPEFAAFLVEHGIDSMSLNPDSVISVVRRVAEVEAHG